MEDGFKIINWDDEFGYYDKGEQEPDPKTVQFRVPYLNFNYEREPGFIRQKPMSIPENGWILTDYYGRRALYSEKEFKQQFKEIEVNE